MTRIHFLCHRNICRSPMSKFIMKDLVKKARLKSRFQIRSAATKTEEINNSVYPLAHRKLVEHSIDCTSKTACQLRNSDYGQYDFLFGIDNANLRNMYQICEGDFDGKPHLLMELPIILMPMIV